MEVSFSADCYCLSEPVLRLLPRFYILFYSLNIVSFLFYCFFNYRVPLVTFYVNRLFYEWLIIDWQRCCRRRLCLLLITSDSRDFYFILLLIVCLYVRLYLCYCLNPAFGCQITINVMHVCCAFCTVYHWSGFCRPDDFFTPATVWMYLMVYSEYIRDEKTFQSVMCCSGLRHGRCHGVEQSVRRARLCTRLCLQRTGW